MNIAAEGFYESKYGLLRVGEVHFEDLSPGYESRMISITDVRMLPPLSVQVPLRKQSPQLGLSAISRVRLWPQ